MSKINSISPHSIITWHDSEGTGAVGWIVIHNLVNGISGGGLFMHEFATLKEVEDLAYTMSLKNTLQDPVFGGGKAGIKFNPQHPEAKFVLKRFLKDNLKIIQTIWCTGGDLNTTTKEITEMLAQISTILSPFSCLANMIARCCNLQINMSSFQNNINNQENRCFTIGDIITGWSVFKTIQVAFQQKKYKPKIVVQGFGKIGKSVCYCVKECVDVVGIIERDWFVYNPKGIDINFLLSLPTVNFESLQNFKPIVRNIKESSETFLIHAIKACNVIDIFCPCATRYVISEQVLKMLIEKTNTTVGSYIIAGSNNVFEHPQLIPIAYANKIIVIPEWISNCGQAILFSEALKHQNKSLVWNELIKLTVTERILNFLSKAEKIAKEHDLNIYDSCYRLAHQTLLSAYEK